LVLLTAFAWLLLLLTRLLLATTLLAGLIALLVLLAALVGVLVFVCHRGRLLIGPYAKRPGIRNVPALRKKSRRRYVLT